MNRRACRTVILLGWRSIDIHQAFIAFVGNSAADKESATVNCLEVIVSLLWREIHDFHCGTLLRCYTARGYQLRFFT